MNSIAQFTSEIRRLPRRVAMRIAEECAPILTELSLQTFNASETPYGVPWDPSDEGNTVTLVKTGALKKTIKYVAIGTKLRVSLGVPYAKYQIGKRPVFPTQGGQLPQSFVAALQRKAVEICREEFGGRQ
ncbi:MAG: hypothetical protein FWD73_06935 [Polyangiaceae bacterium]|nr:hypothetical protein [Polyangiaceae bacterium]